MFNNIKNYLRKNNQTDTALFCASTLKNPVKVMKSLYYMFYFC